MKKNLITLTATELYEQIVRVKEATGSELEQETIRLSSMSQGAEQMANLADKEVKLIIGMNIIPQDSMLIVGIKEVVDKPRKITGLLAEEFNRTA